MRLLQLRYWRRLLRSNGKVLFRIEKRNKARGNENGNAIILDTLSRNVKNTVL